MLFVASTMTFTSAFLFLVTEVFNRVVVLSTVNPLMVSDLIFNVLHNSVILTLTLDDEELYVFCTEWAGSTYFVGSTEDVTQRTSPQLNRE